MKTLEKKVEAMLNGEKKRREVAIQWLGKVEAILIPVAPDIWGDGKTNDHTAATPVKNQENTDTVYYMYYFRYEKHEGEYDTEYTGFYYGAMYDNDDCVWGQPVAELKGTDFWHAIRTIVEWIPVVEKLLDEKSQSREKLCELLNAK
jgi:hypothetical protein